MTTTTIRARHLASLLLGQGLALALTLATASAPAAASSAAFTTLSAEMLELDRQARALEATDTATPIFIGATLEKAWLREVRVQVDALEAVRYQFSEVEARALQAGGLHLLTALSLEPGQHRLRAELVAREAIDKPQASRYSTKIDSSFMVGGGGAVELRMSRGGFMGGSEGSLLQPSVADARRRSAAYLAATDRAYAAMVELGGASAPMSLPAEVAAGSPDLAARYNAAVALYQQDPAQAIAELDALGKLEPQSSTGLALRDLANLTLGYCLLRSARGTDAEPVFDRIRSPGPYANAAMLGLGWSYLLPAGGQGAGPAQPAAASVLRPGSDDAVAAVRRQMPFRYLNAVASGERATDIRRALIPWTELIGRDPLDPSVQEGMLALPYALDHFGAHEQAQVRYRQAVEKLEAARGTLAAAAQQLDGGDLFAALDRRDADTSSGWARLLVNQRDDTELVPLRVLATDPGFASAMRDYRELRSLDAAAADHERQLQQLDAGNASGLLARLADFRARVAAALGVSQQQLRAAGHKELQRIGQQTERYLAEAHFALARIYDRVPRGETSR